jgi:hypothetical protein
MGRQRTWQHPTVVSIKNDEVSFPNKFYFLRIIPYSINENVFLQLKDKQPIYILYRKVTDVTLFRKPKLSSQILK